MDEIYNEINRFIADSDNVQQIPFLNENQFLSLCRDYQTFLSRDELYVLWKHGLVNAILVESSDELSTDELDKICGSAEKYIYIDNRSTPSVSKWRDILSNENYLPDNLTLYFHKFQYWYLRSVLEKFEYNISPLQYLRYHDGANELVSSYNDKIFPTFGKSIDEHLVEIKNTTTLCIACEPFSYPKISRKVRFSYPYNSDSIHEAIEDRRNNIEEIIRKIGLDKMEAFRRELCIACEVIDPNKILHISLRLMNIDMRNRLKGNIGASMLVFTMAECLRLISEEIFQTELPEEDELGFGQWMKDAKKKIFGANRIYDAKDIIKKEFHKQYGVNYSTVARCYVEGDSEMGAMASLLMPTSKIDLINLKGSVIEKKGKGVAFRESLRDDLKNNVFSIIMLDADSDNNVRAVRKASEDDEICGRVFYNDPDLEFGNFTFDELLIIVNRYALQQNISEVSSDKFTVEISTINTGKLFSNQISRINTKLGEFVKSQDWGKNLMDFALENKEYPDDHSETGERMLFQLAQLIVRTATSYYNYNTTRESFTVNPKTGDLIARKDMD